MASENDSNPIFQRIKLGLIGFAVAALLMIPALMLEKRNDELTNLIIASVWCEYHGPDKPFTENTPECIERKKHEPGHRSEEERNESILVAIYVSAASIAAISAVFIMIVFLKNLFRDRVAPAASKIREGYNIDQAVKKIDKYKKLLDEGVMTQEQFDKKAKELQKSIDA